MKTLPPQMKKQGLFAGTVVLLCSNLFVKGIGFFYRVFLVRLLGTEGIGLIEMVIPLYSFLLVIAGWGISLATSQSIAEASVQNKQKDAMDTFKTAFLILGLFGLIITVLSWLLLPYLVKYFVPDQRIFLCFQYILPSIMIITVASAYRGYFQGVRQISNLGMSQSIEQSLRVAFGIVLTLQLLQMPLEKAVTAPAIATVIGEAGGFCYLLYCMNREKRAHPLLPRGQFQPIIARRLLKFGTPVTIGRVATTAIFMLQAFLIPFSLQQAGWDTHQATEIYGRFAGVCMTLLHLPGIFTNALSVSVVPAIAETYAANHKLFSSRIINSLQATMVFTFPGMILLFLFADELCNWLFNSPLSAPTLRLLTIAGIFIYMQGTLGSILQGMGRVKQLLIYSIISGAILLIGIILLTPIPQLGINGVAIAVNLSALVGFGLNLGYLLKISQVKLPWNNIFGKPLTAGLICLLIGVFLKPYLYQWIGLDIKIAALIAALLLFILYFIILSISGGLDLSIIKRHLSNRKPV